MMLGEANVASPTIRSLSGSFGLWGLVDKLLAIVPDASVKASSSLVELVKSLTGEDALDIDRKNLAPLSSVNLTARLMVIANHPPVLADPSGALAQRMVILETRRSWAGKEEQKAHGQTADGASRHSAMGHRRLATASETRAFPAAKIVAALGGAIRVCSVR